MSQLGKQHAHEGRAEELGVNGSVHFAHRFITPRRVQVAHSWVVQVDLLDFASKVDEGGPSRSLALARALTLQAPLIQSCSGGHA